MLTVISPAKSLNFDQEHVEMSSKPVFNKETQDLIKVLKQLNTDDIRSLMSLSEDLGKLNYNRFQTFKSRTSEKNSIAAIQAFKGEVYVGFDFDTLDVSKYEFAQSHLSILSGLYGALRPFDLIQPYRLEMGTKLKTDDFKNLYQFWGEKIAKELNKRIKVSGSPYLINLASNEYFKSVDKKVIKSDIIDIEFKDFKNGEYKVLSFFAKKARGLMSRFIMENEINSPEELKNFNTEGYIYDSNSSTDNKYCFLRG